MTVYNSYCSCFIDKESAYTGPVRGNGQSTNLKSVYNYKRTF